MKNIRPINPKFLNSPGGNSVIGVRKLNPILMGKVSIDSMELNEIPEQTTGQIQEPVFFKSEQNIVTPEVQPAVVAAMPEEMVQGDVSAQVVPTPQPLEIEIPGMGYNTSEVNADEDPSIAQAIDSELTEAGKIIEPVATSNVLNFPGNPIVSQVTTPDLTNVDQTEGFGLRTAAQFEEDEAAKRIGTEAPVAKQVVPDMVVPEYNLQSDGYFPQNSEIKVPEEMVQDIPGAFNDEFVELAKAIKDLETFSQNKIADVRATLTLLSDQTKTVCAELDRKVSIAKERRDIDNKAILDSVRTETQRVVDQASGVQYSQDLSQMGRVA